MAKKPKRKPSKKASNKVKKPRKRLKVKEKPMFQLINDVLLDCHQHIIKAPLTKDQLADMEGLMLRSAEAYMDDKVAEVWCLFGTEMKEMLVREALKSLYVN